jgi:hypothetical protein
MTDHKPNLTTEERVNMGQSVARGDTGNGNTGVPEFEQGISNRPGDADGADQLDDVMTNAPAKNGTGDDAGPGPGGDADELKARQARGNLGPEHQEGFGQGG